MPPLLVCEETLGQTYDQPKLTNKIRDSCYLLAFYDDYILAEICETASAMEKPLAPEVRSQFARRLREMRVGNGFLRARYFAKSLGIEENRYTRYERAEVEPNLTLIHKMCEMLGVTPNELLGFAEYEGPRVPGFAENPSRTSKDGEEEEVAPSRDLLAWRLASKVSAIRKQRGGAKLHDDPLATTRETGKLFQSLQSDPFGTVAEIVGDGALKALDSDEEAELAELIDAFTKNVANAATDKSRR